MLTLTSVQHEVIFIRYCLFHIFIYHTVYYMTIYQKITRILVAITFYYRHNLSIQKIILLTFYP